MTFFDEVSKRLNYAMTEVSSRTKEFTSVTKLNTSISAREREIESAYAQIGKLLFEREAADPESPAAALCAKIAANHESIADMKQRIAKIKEEGKETRKSKSDELFHSPAETVTVNAQDVTDDTESNVEEPCSCCQKAAEAAEAAVETVADAAEAVADAAAEKVEPVVDAAEKACDCACGKAADAAEAVAEKVESAAKDLSDFYKKPDDNA